MQEERNQRYVDKLVLAQERISNIKEWHENSSDLKSRLATYKAFQEATEALMDICSMICRDEERLVKDDYDNIESLVSLKLIDKELADSLKEMNGMRNRVVHEYNGFSNKMFSGNVDRLLEAAEKFIGVVQEWIEKGLKK